MPIRRRTLILSEFGSSGTPTSTRQAPWTLVEANDKYFALLKVLATACESLEAQLR